MSLPEKISTTADIDVETSVIMLLFVHLLICTVACSIILTVRKRLTPETRKRVNLLIK